MASAKPSSSKSRNAAITTRSADESVLNVKLIGRCTHQIIGSKLPSKRQVLQLLFFHVRVGKLPQRESSIMTVKEIFLFWEKARIPTQYETRCVDKVDKLYESWRLTTKFTRKSQSQIKKITDYTDSLDDLFDIAASDALEQMKNEEDRRFLELQRKKGRPGCMVGVDIILALQEQRTAERNKKEDERKKKHDEMMQQNSKNFSF